ncbi:glycoside hydrolase domain-containing protein [Fodinicola acaciae]|uniref:glycoside hydrolase domain-containing protein n=1 Tax=Fodinicola acaciae TaxID=2681555 RepID=UPI0013D67126|nr:glycoside hydrolase domain-containing protein [Fodinicola acaciae]
MSLVAACAVALSVAGSVPASAEKAAKPPADGPITSVWTENSSVNLFKDDLAAPDVSRSVSITLARNEYEAAQVAIRKDRDFTIRGVSFGPLTSGTHALAAANLSYRFVEFSHLNHNSAFAGRYPIANPIRTGPGDYPDGLSNDRSVRVPANTTQPIWIRAYAPKDAAPGVYTGTATIVTDTGQSAVPISIDIRNVTIPDNRDSGFTRAMWMTTFGPLSWDEGAGDTIKLYYGLDRYSPKWWQLMGNLAAMMKAYRNNDLPVPLVTALIDGGSYLDANGTYHFNWQRFDQLVQFFMERGAVKQLEGFWWSFGAKDGIMQTEIIAPPQNGKTGRAYVPTGGAEEKRWTSQFLPALRDHIQAKGWEKIYWMHVNDELPPDQVDRYVATAKAIRAVWPQVRISDANNVQSSQAGIAAVQSFHIPSIILTNENPAFYDQQIKNGKDVWIYTANIPTGTYLNRFIDQPAYDQRETMWYAYQHGITGYLHWALNNWQYTLDQQDVKGDGYIVLPDKENNTFKSTIRFESYRDGAEDYELLKLLEKTKPALAKGLAASVVSNATRYSRDTGFITRIHNALVAAAAGDSIFPTVLGTAGAGQLPVQVDLKKQAQVDGLRINVSSAKSFSVELSYDGEKWSPAYTTSSAESGDTFVGVNGKARYARIVGDGAVSSVQVGGSYLAQENLAGGRPYEKSDPNLQHPDTGNALSTDGVIAGDYPDRKSWGYDLSSGQSKTVDVTVDLAANKTVGRISVHRYEDWDARYSPDIVAVSTSDDGKTFVQKGFAKKTNAHDGLWYDYRFPAVSARFVRVTFTKTCGSLADALFIDEIEAYAPPPGQDVNFAAGATYRKSAEPDDPTFPDTGNHESTDGVIAGNFFDGNGYAYYMTPGKSRTVSITLELKGPRTLNRATVAKYNDDVHNYAPDNVKVYTSVDGASFQYKGQTAWGSGGWFDLPFDDTFALYVRLDLTKKDGYFADYLFVDEIGLFGDPNSATTNLALGKTYTKSGGGDPNYPDSTPGDSTDGFIAGHYSDHKSYAWVMQPGDTLTVDITVDLGAVKDVQLVRFWRYNDGEHGYAPDSVKVSTSVDGSSFVDRATVTAPAERWFVAGVGGVGARYVRFTATKKYGYFAEYIFADEVEVYGK